MTRQRASTIAQVAQAGSAASVGAFIASIEEPPEGARWALIAAAVGLAAVAAVYQRRAAQ
jgi:hypothetical protein